MVLQFDFFKKVTELIKNNSIENLTENRQYKNRSIIVYVRFYSTLNNFENFREYAP